jgi:hypothetical protein
VQKCPFNIGAGKPVLESRLIIGNTPSHISSIPLKRKRRNASPLALALSYRAVYAQLSDQ